MRRAAFLTMDTLEDFVAYDELAKPPLRERGWHIEDVPWRSGADWDAYEAVVIRTPWDYHTAPGDFLDVLYTIEASRARLANPLDAVRWNLDKTYLRALESRDVPIVPTVWGHGLTPDTLAALRAQLGGEIVVKPIVGANADDTFRLGPEADTPTEAGALATFADRPFMAQPFVRSIVEWGETSLFFFGGTYSHAILKTPASGDFRVQEEHGGQIRAMDPPPALRAAAQRAVEAAVEITGADLLYARPDLVRLGDGSWALIELEIIEPSLYFPFDADSPA
ncbi:MAG: hypothetical protein AAF791_07440, partial [Bacteroidota bacterium]